VLYVMTCGYYPFGGRDEFELFARLQGGTYQVPATVSETCANLIGILLSPDPTSRQTIPALLNHQWLQSPFPQSHGSDVLSNQRDQLPVQHSPFPFTQTFSSNNGITLSSNHNGNDIPKKKNRNTNIQVQNQNNTNHSSKKSPNKPVANINDLFNVTLNNSTFTQETLLGKEKHNKKRPLRSPVAVYTPVSSPGLSFSLSTPTLNTNDNSPESSGTSNPSTPDNSSNSGIRQERNKRRSALVSVDQNDRKLDRQ